MRELEEVGTAAFFGGCALTLGIVAADDHALLGIGCLAVAAFCGAAVLSAVSRAHRNRDK